METEETQFAGSGDGPKRKRTIDSFFSPKPKKDRVPTENTGEAAAGLSGNPTAVTLTQTQHVVVSVSHVSQPGISTPSTSSSPVIPQENENPSVYGSDVGLYVEKRSELDDFTKCLLLERPWSPPDDYIFPHFVIKKSGKDYRKFAQRSHLEKFHWLVLSHKDQGYYCKYCVLFAPDESGAGGGRPLKKLVKQPLIKFDNVLGEQGDLMIHEKNKYHQNAVSAGKDFLVTYHNPNRNVLNQVSSQRQLQVDDNRARLRPIVQTIVLCGRENVPLRGHRDNGRLYDTEATELITEGPVESDGLFRALLRFKVESGDKILKEHLLTAGANATYISSTTQNELIDCCKEEIQSIILERVKAAPVYSIMFDETTDIAHIEQLSLSFRYVYQGVIREDFVTFANAYELIRQEDQDDENQELRLTGVALAHIVEDLLVKFSVDITKCVGIGTDSCSVMSSEVVGAVQEIAKRAINARRCPCSNHMLNNSLSKTTKVIPCRNTTGTMKKVISFANASAKRHAVFVAELGTGLKGLCETRWGEKHDGHLQFRTSLPKVCKALETISQWKDNKTASEAYCLLQALRSSEFLVSTICLCDVLGTTVSLSRLLQSPTLDLKNASDAIADTVSVLENKRQDVDSVFQEIFAEVQQLAATLEVEVTAPRTTQNQIHRDNQPATSNEEYFRRAIYVPLLDYILADVRDRFPEEVLHSFNLRVFMPKESSNEEQVKLDTETVKSVARQFEKLLGVVPRVTNEYPLWATKWRRELQKGTPLPTSVVEVLSACDKKMYPSIYLLLTILATLPVSVATAERSFSTLRRLKTWLRSRMGEERLTGLALLHVHRDISVNIENIIDRFANSKRKLEFVL